MSWTSSSFLEAAGATEAPSTPPEKSIDKPLASAPPDKEAGLDTPWGQPSAGSPNGCETSVSLKLTVQGRAATIRGDGGRICDYWMTADTPARQGRNSEELLLNVPLARPLLLGSSSVLVVLTYHAEQREGWAKGRLAARVNDGNLIFDRLGRDGESGEIRIPVARTAILTANGLAIRVYLQGEAEFPGFQRLALDAVTLQVE